MAGMQHLRDEDIIRLAPNETVAIESVRLAASDAWSHTGQDGVHIWGTFATETRTLRVMLNLALLDFPAAGMSCTCREQHPCAHCLGLLLMFRDHSEHFPSSTTPNDVRGLFMQRPEARAPEHLYGEVERGLLQLKDWLNGLIRQGLGEPRLREFAFWDAMATRMQAAWMPNLAQWLRDIANIPVRGGDWAEALLDELGRLYLLALSFERYQALAPEVQSDLRQAVGWHVPEHVDTLEAIQDNWLVTGIQRRLVYGQKPHQLTWLHGAQSGRAALLQSTGAEAVMKLADWRIGQTRAATLGYEPSRAPLKTTLIDDNGLAEYAGVRGLTIPDAVTQAGRMLALNPWQRHVPVLLDDVFVARFHRGWTVRDAAGTYLPVAPYFVPKWAFYAVSGGEPIQVAGLWNGSVLYPLSAIAGGRPVDFSTIVPYRDGQRGKS